jgi:asparagine synthetase B (glutamine-hydrolysing)
VSSTRRCASSAARGSDKRKDERVIAHIREKECECVKQLRMRGCRVSINGPRDTKFKKKTNNNKENLVLNNDFYSNDNDHFYKKFQEYDNKSKDLKKRIFSFDLKNYLTNTLLRDSDIASMSNSIELRPVFLDHKLVELAASTTKYAEINYNNSKLALRNIYKKS